MTTTTYRGTLTAVSELHHGGDEQTGNVRLLRTIKMWDVDAGRLCRVPIIAGNAIRGVLRRLLMRDMLERIDYGPASTRLHHALYSGGVLESTSETSGALDLPYRRKLVEALPPVALLGTAVINQMVPGQLVVDMARPFCRETAWALRAMGYDDPRLDTDARAFRDFTFTTRHDDLRDDAEASHQMIVTFEYFASGTAFAHAFRLRHPTPLLESTVGAMLALWADDPVIGGKIAGGFGQLAIDYPDAPDPALYDEYLDSHAAGIRDLLDDLAQRLEGKAKPGGRNVIESQQLAI